jgi:hypothetical protein
MSAETDPHAAAGSGEVIADGLTRADVGIRDLTEAGARPAPRGPAPLQATPPLTNGSARRLRLVPTRPGGRIGAWRFLCTCSP